MTRVHCLWLALAVLPACSGDAGPNPPPSNGHGLMIVPSELEVEVGASGNLQARVTDNTGAVVPTPVVTWTSNNVSVATVNAGSVTGVSVGTTLVIASATGAVDTATVRVLPPVVTGPAVEIFPEVAYQVMNGWEGTAQIGEADCKDVEGYRTELLNRLVNELGINRVRLHVRSGHENPVDYYTMYRNSHNLSDWNPHRFESVNDNNDPQVIRAAGFQFAEIDHKVDVIVNPMRQLLQARGERLYVNLNYVDFGALQPWEQASNPQEYAELILAVFQHLQQKYGWVPDALEVSLEPDNTANWSATVLAQAMVAAGDRLKAAGYRPDFIAPSNENMSAALDYLNSILSVPRTLEYITDVAYHRYSGVSDAALTGIAARATQYGLRTAMLEHIGSGYQDLVRDVRDGRNSAWSQFVLAYCKSVDDGGDYFLIDNSTPGSPRLVPGSRTKYLRQYFSFIRFGAQRIGASSGDARLEPLAFRNPSGKLVIVIAASNSAQVSLRRLPAGTYGVTITTASQTFTPLPDLVVGASGTAQAAMPAAGVMTVYAR